MLLRWIGATEPAVKPARSVGPSSRGAMCPTAWDDRARQNALVAAGWTVLRFTWSHLQDPDYVLSQIVQYLAA